jgi:acetyl esterase/lipase
VLWSAKPSRRSLVYAIFLRLLLRPWISLAAWISAIGIRFGPAGIEMWRLWEWMLRLTDWVGLLSPAPRGTTIERTRLADCRAEWVRAQGVIAGKRAVLWLHGGGFVGCGLATHRRFVARISSAAEADVLNVAYRMLPRAPITSAIEDGLAGYAKLLEAGFAPDQIVIGGDSAGGGLAFLVAAAAIARGMPRPAGLVALSPWADLDVTRKLSHRCAHTDPVIPIKAAAFVVDALISKGQPLDRELSAVNLDLGALPPVLIHVGTTEVLEPDAIGLAEGLAAVGVPVTLKHWQGQVHTFQILGLDLLPEARAAIREVGEFVADATTGHAR